MSSKIQGLTVVINGDVTPLSRAMRQAKSEATVLRTHMASLGQLLKFDPGNVDLTAQKQRMLGQAIAQNARTYQAYQAAHAEYAGRVSSLTAAERTQFAALEREMTRNRVEFQRLRSEAVAFGAAAAPGTIAFSNSMKSMSAQMRGYSNLALAASVATGVVGAALVKAAADYEYAFADVRKTIDATESEYRELSDAAIEMSLRKPTSAEDIAYIMSLGGQLNIAAQHLEKFADTTADLDVATNLDLDSASIDLARFMNITKTGQGDIDRLGATIVDLGNNSATTEADIMAMAMRIAGTGSSLGMTAAEVLAMATSLSSVGIQAEMGGNAISTIMRRIDKDVAKNSATLQTWADTAGMSAADFRALWASDVSSAMFEVFKGIGRIQDEGGNLTLLLDELGVSSMRQVDTMMRLAQAGDMGAAITTRANNAWQQNSALASEVSQRYDTATAKMQMMRNAAQAAAVAFGDELLPEFSDVVVGASDLVKWLGSLDSETKATVIDIGAAAIGIGLLSKGVQVTAGGIGTLTGAAASAKTALSGWAETVHAAAAASEARAAIQARDTATATANTAATAANTASRATATAADAAATAGKGALATSTAAATAATAASTAANGAAATSTGVLTTSVLGLSSALGISTTAAMGLFGLLAAAGVAALVGVAAATKSAEDAARRYTASTEELSRAVGDAQAEYDRAASAFGENSDEAAKAAYALDEATQAYENGRESVEAYCDRLSDMHGAYEQTRQAMEDATGEADAQAGAMLTLAERVTDTYESMDAGAEKTAAMVSLIDSLTEAAGDLGISYDAQTDSLLLNNEAMEDYRAAIGEVVKAQADQARYQAASESYSSALAAQIDLETELAVAKSELARAQQEVNENYSAEDAKWQGRAGAIRSMSAEARAARQDEHALGEEVSKLSADVADAKAKQTAYIDTMTRLKTEELAAAEAIRLHEGESMALEDAVARVNETSGASISVSQAEAQMRLEAAEAAQVQAAADEELEEEIGKVAEGLTDLMAKNATFAKFMADGNISVDALAAAMQETGASAEDLGKRMEEFAAATADGLKKIEEARTSPEDADDDDWIDAGKLKANLDANYQVAERWGSAVEALYAKHGDAASAAFIGYIEDMGYEYIPLLEELAGASDAKWAEIVASYNRNIETGNANALIQFEQFAGQYTATAEQLSQVLGQVMAGGNAEAAQRFMEGIEALGTGAQPVIEALASMTEEELSRVVAAYETGGMDAAQRLIDSLSSKGGDVKQAAADAMAGTTEAVDAGSEGWSAKVDERLSAVEQGIAGARPALYTAAAGLAGQVAEGIGSMDAPVSSQADALSKLTADHFSSAKGDAAQAGRSMAGDHFTGGVTGSTGPVAGGADTISKLAADHFSSAKADARRAGLSMAEGFAAGIRAGKGQVTAAAAEMTRAVPATSKKVGEVNSPSRVMRRLGPSWPEGLADGIRRGTWQVERASTHMARAAEAAAQSALAPRAGAVGAAPRALSAVRLADQGRALALRGGGDTYITNNNTTNNVGDIDWSAEADVARASEDLFRTLRQKLRA